MQQNEMIAQMVSGLAERLGANGGTPEEWTQMRTAPLDYLRHRATARLAIPDADVAAIARLVPGYLAPSGRLQAELQFGPAGER